MNRKALFVASSGFRDKQLSRLAAPGHDVSDLHDVLSDPSIGNFDVDLVVNSDSAAARRSIEQFFLVDAQYDDLLLFFYSGHGLKDETGRLYLATVDTTAELLRSTGLAAEFLSDVMSASRARQQVVVLDCCFSGAFPSGLTAKADHTVGIADELAKPAGKGRVVLAASNAVQYSFEALDPAANRTRSVYTAALVTGLRTGEADLDHDGLVTASEWHEYALRQVKEAAPNQKPRMWAFDMDSQPEIARATRVAGRPSQPTPPMARQPQPARGSSKGTKRRNVAAAIAVGATVLAGIVIASFAGDDSTGSTSSSLVTAAEVTSESFATTLDSLPTTLAFGPGTETGAPELLGVTLDNAQPNPGDSVQITVDAANATGVDAVFFSRPSGVSATLPMSPFRRDGNLFSASIDLPQNEASGHWIINTIVLHGHDNTQYHFSHPDDSSFTACEDGFQDIGSPACTARVLTANGEFDVGGTNVELADPVLNTVVFEPSEVKPGDEFTMKVDVDGAEGIRTAFFAFEPSGDTISFQVVPFVKEDGQLTAKVTVPTFAARGTYRIAELIVVDGINEIYGFLNTYLYPSSNQCPGFEDLGARFSCASLAIADPALEVLGE